MRPSSLGTVLLGGLIFATPALAVTATEFDARLTQAEVEAAQQAWGEALVQIATRYEEKGLEAARETAGEILDAAYGYDLGPVLFKPTLAGAPHNFRTTREGALAYFVGHDEAYPEDAGFALKPWRSVEIDNAAITISGDMAITQGSVRMTDSSGAETVVDKSWAFQRDAQGDLRIVLHHSSLPYPGE